MIELLDLFCGGSLDMLTGYRNASHHVTIMGTLSEGGGGGVVEGILWKWVGVRMSLDQFLGD